MATGDMKNNLRKLLSELKLIRYPYQVDWNSVNAGLSQAFLPIMHYLFVDYSQELASFVSNKNYDLFAKSDLKFVEMIYKIFIQLFSYKPTLSKDKFFSSGFAERKVIFLTDIIKICREKHAEISSSKKQHVSGKPRLPRMLQKNKRDQGNDRPKSPATNVLSQSGVAQDKARIKDHQSETKLPEASSKLATSKSIPIAESSKEIDRTMIPLNPPVPVSSVRSVEPPSPSPSLTLTPLKYNEQGPPAEDQFQESSVVTVEKIDIDTGRTAPVRIVRHATRVDNDNTQNEEPTTLPLVEKTAFLATKFHEETVSIVPSEQRNDSRAMRKNTKEHDQICSGCIQLQKDVASLTGNFQELKALFKDTMTVNNELAARVVLLETKTKLLEDQLDKVKAQSESTNQSSDVPIISAKGLAGREILSRRTQDDNGVLPSKPQNNSPAQILSNGHDNYSPVKYMDEELSVPLDFQPINLEEIGLERLLNDDDNRQLNPANSDIENPEDRSPRPDSPDLPICDSEIAGFNSDYFNTPLRNAFTNVNKKLIETTNILKQSSAYVTTDEMP